MLFDFQTIPTREAYKLLVSTVVPRPIAWVVSQDAGGVVNAAPFSFFNAFGDTPPVIGFSCGPRPEGVEAPVKDTLANIRATGQFVVCLVNEALGQAMSDTATDFAPETDELAEVGLERAPSLHVKPPRIAAAPVAMECETFQLVPVGVHTLVLGRVLAMHVQDEGVLDAAKYYIDTPKLNLIGRMHGRGWYTRTTDRIDIPRTSRAQWEARKAEKK
ncbi:flavin reductase family protein [Pseudoroseomonas cervicalis]|uniref:flavin reductase family protein n=1 Tax=Teichococcus cervicalis TaxID=204525 RepID=UPI002788E9B0|nr:flavin reductase family protein [Pseudoroseomonas cervicalis]MDQ1078903.1 flavin reductase (DIM6/NTAB) family NADH-FMN oxidoreductase RutF [Pseudoroseomonas cervicalis]